MSDFDKKRFRKGFEIDNYLHEFLSNNKEVLLFKKFLSKDLVEQIDWQTLTVIDEEERHGFEFSGVVYRCKISDSPANLLVARTARNIKYPDIILSLFGSVLAWMRICFKNGASKFPIVIPMVFYSGDYDVLYPSDKNIRIWDVFENPSLAQQIWSAKPICLVDFTGLTEEEINGLYFLKTAYSAPNQQEELRTITQQLEQRGRTKGQLDERITIARKMLEAKVDPQIVMNCTGLSAQEMATLSVPP